MSQELEEFDDVLNVLRGGRTLDEASEQLREVVAACRETGKKGGITLTIEVKPGAGRQVEIIDKLKATVPEPARESTHLFDNDQGGLQRNDPRQGDLDGVRTVADEQDNQPLRSV